MHVSRLTLTNVRQFESRMFEFQPNFNLLVGENGVGKTTILRSLLAALGSAQQTGRRPKLTDEDVRLRSSRAEIEVELITSNGENNEVQFYKELWRPSRRSYQGDHTPLVLIYASNEATCGSMKTRRLPRFGEVEKKEMRRSEEFLYEREREWTQRATDVTERRFGSSRSVRAFVGKMLSTFSPAFRDFYWRFEPYDCSLLALNTEAPPFFSRLRNQVRTFVMRYLQEEWRYEKRSRHRPWPDQASIVLDRESSDRKSSLLPDLRMIWKSMKVSPNERKFLETCSLEIRLAPRIMIRHRDGPLQLSQLSDGEQRLFSLFVDIARQLSLQNQNGEIGSGEAIILIDEIDVHLHPKWQRKIIPALQDLFRGCQFIATTHSPFVIQAVNNNQVQHVDKHLMGDFKDRGIEEIALRVMGIENHQVSQRYLEMLDTAKKYFQMLEGNEVISPSDQKKLRAKLRKLSSPYADNPAYQAYLEIHSNLKLGKGELR